MGRRTRAKVSVTDKPGRLLELRRQLEQAKDGAAYVKVGILGGPKDRRPGDPIGNVELATVHEFGSRDGKIPERSFLRRTFDKQLPEIHQLAKKLVAGIYDGKVTVPQALGLLGAKFSADVKRTVTTGAGVPPPNAPRTLARKEAKTRRGSKGGVRTLIDTGRMITALAWQVVVDGKEGAQQSSKGEE